MPLVDDEGEVRSDNPLGTLREYFVAHASEATLEFLFGDFEQATRLIDAVDIEWRSKDMWCPLEMAMEREHRPNNLYYQTLVKRVSALRQFLGFGEYASLKSALYPREVTLALHLWLDAHFPLMLGYEQGEYESDAQVDSATFPALQHIFSEGELPDISSAFMNSDFWEKKKVSAKIPLVSIITKAHPLRCQIRGLAKTLHKRCTEDSTMFDFWRAFMMASALGVYSRTTQETLGFWERKALYAVLFYNGREESVMRWIVLHTTQIKDGKSKDIYHHQNTIMLMLREFVQFSIHMLPGLKRVIQSRYRWTQFENDVISNADAMRAMMRKNAQAMRDYRDTSLFVRSPEKVDAFLETLFSGVEGMVDAAAKQKNFDLYKPRPHDFFTVGLSLMDHFAEKALIEGLPMPQVPERLLDVIRRVVRVHDPLLGFRVSEDVPKTPDDIDFYVENNILPIKCFGLSAEDVHRVVDAQRIYPEFKERCVDNMLKKISSREQFVIVHTIFREAQAHRAVALLPLPVHTFLQQLSAIKQKYAIPPDRPIPRHLGSYLVCINCQNFKGLLSKPKPTGSRSKKDYQYYFIGNQDVIVDDDTGKLYCAGKKKKNDSKKQLRKDISSMPVGSAVREKAIREENAKAVKLFEKNKVDRRCPETELVRVPMLGYGLKFFGRLLMLCPRCATPMEYHWTKYALGELSCKNCPSAEMLRSDVHCAYCNMIDTSDVAGKFEVIDNVFETARQREQHHSGYIESVEKKTVYLCKKCHNCAKSALKPHIVKDIHLSALLDIVEERKRATNANKIKQ